MKMEKRAQLFSALIFFLAGITAAGSSGTFDNNFSKSCPETHFKTSEDGQIWYLSLDKQAGCGFMTKQKYRFGWFSMKLKLVGGDSAGVVTAFYMCSENAAGPERDELDIEFLGNRTGQPYIIQTNIYKNGTGNREMRHSLWFDPTDDFHTYSILWNNHQIVFFVDQVPIRVFKNANYTNTFFPNSKPMYLFSSIWNADDWATKRTGKRRPSCRLTRTSARMHASGRIHTRPASRPPRRIGGISTMHGIYRTSRSWTMRGCRGTLLCMIIARIRRGLQSCQRSVGSARGRERVIQSRLFSDERLDSLRIFQSSFFSFDYWELRICISS